ncbi:MAG: Uma2 family endonuclease [Myxococcales bacterium]|nr:Uma2 family endonuclease [Myxococcales bacterium]
MAPVRAQREHVFSFEEYVQIASRSPNRVELWEGVILDMSGGSPRHSAICSNIVRILGNQLRGNPCRVFEANLKVRSLRANRTTYADATVVCGPLELDPADPTRQTVLNPALLFEVLSPSTEADDRGPKLDCYQSIASVHTVVLVAQGDPEVTVHERGADGAWSQTRHQRGSVTLSAIGCTLPLAEVYEDLPDE